ncbi:hypothetical protein O181_081424 [Austropuccinia psidii MF-1]|uniref:ATPase inhibitor, mitochondrial n=1 Tax=Austropuccinia psidii MF-1 TaxID=1389203 RepID=A0A9Q3FMC5_9BASI|nr:hypothetical protein [Austropuccinia psidii MF-1]
MMRASSVPASAKGGLAPSRGLLILRRSPHLPPFSQVCFICCHSFRTALTTSSTMFSKAFQQSHLAINRTIVICPARRNLPRLMLTNQFNTHANPILGPENPGAVSESKGFKDRERSEEARYIRSKEASELKKLRQELEKQKAKIDELEKSVNAKK